MKNFWEAIYKFCVRVILKIFVILERIGIITFYQPILELGIKTDKDRIERAFTRWDAIKESLPVGKLSVLDIGSNVGFYCLKLAELGHFATGLDSHTFSTIAYLAKEALSVTNVTYASLLVDPDNIDSLPNYDCILLLAVFHHWCRSYGKENALKMLRTVYKKTNKILYFMTGQSDNASEKYISVLPDMGDNPEQWMKNFFIDLGSRKVNTIENFKGRFILAVHK